MYFNCSFLLILCISYFCVKFKSGHNFALASLSFNLSKNYNFHLPKNPPNIPREKGKSILCFCNLHFNIKTIKTSPSNLENPILVLWNGKFPLEFKQTVLGHKHSNMIRFCQYQLFKHKVKPFFYFLRVKYKHWNVLSAPN